MKYLAIFAAILTAFWCGAVWSEARRPAPIVKIIKAEPAHNCKQLVRQCWKERKERM